jgi:hypothetical protein
MIRMVRMARRIANLINFLMKERIIPIINIIIITNNIGGSPKIKAIRFLIL